MRREGRMRGDEEGSKDERKYDEMQETGGELRYDVLLVALIKTYRRILRDKYRG
jgi:hypothetical protein